MKRLLAGSIALPAGIAALLVAHAHRPVDRPDIAKSFGGQNVLGMLTLYKPGSAWTVTAYDAVHIAGVVLVSLGGAALIVGLALLARRVITR